MVCRSAFSRLPTAQSEIEPRHRCLQQARPAATNPLDSSGALPKSCTAGSSVRIIRGRHGLTFFVTWLHLMGELSPKVTEGENLWRRTCKPAQIGMYVISPSVKTYGFDTFLIRGRQGLRTIQPSQSDISFEILNQWISKRGFQISWNRIETQNSRPLNLWGRGFVIYSAAAIGSGHSLPARQLLNTGSACRLIAPILAGRNQQRGSNWDQTPCVWLASISTKRPFSSL